MMRYVLWFVPRWKLTSIITELMCFQMTLSKNESYLWWTKSNNKRRGTDKISDCYAT